MIKKMAILFLCLLAPLSYAHAADINEVSNAVPSDGDLKLNEQARNALQNDAELNPSLLNIQMKTVKGIVYLKGSVSSENEKNYIEKKVGAVSGVAGIQNYIQVNGS